AASSARSWAASSRRRFPRSRQSRPRSKCGRSRSASASRRLSDCSSGCTRQCVPPDSIPLKRSEKNDRANSPAMTFRIALLWEVVAMAFDTVRTNKMRSALTVLGVVIGITSIVGMTAMIRGFDKSLRGLIEQLGPDTIIVSRFSFANFMNGAEMKELMKRPNLTISDSRALEDQSELLQVVDVELGGQGPSSPMSRVFYRDQRTKMLIIFGTTEKFQDGNNIPFLAGRFFNGTEVQYRKNVVVLGNTAYKLLFEPTGIDPIGKTVRVGAEKFEVVGVYAKRAAGGFGAGADDFVVIPYTTYQRIYGLKAVRIMRGGTTMPIQISVVPRDGVPVKEAMAEVERIMRSRHGLKLDE